MHIVCFGDSITHAAAFAEGDRWPTVLQALLNNHRPDTYKVWNRGIGGNTTSQGLDRMAADVLPHLPAMVLIEFGFNDANVVEPFWINRVSLEEFKRNLTEMHRVVSAYDGTPVFIVNHTIACRWQNQANGKPYNENFAPYNPAIREVAAQLDAKLIDLPACMQQRDVDLDSFLRPDDGLHLTAGGQHLYADMVFGALRDQELL